MKLEVDLSGIENARRNMGADKAVIGRLRNTVLAADPIELRLIEKGEIVLPRKALLESLTSPAGLLAIGNTQVTLHIFEPYDDYEALTAMPASGPKFHICDCDTLDAMKDKGRFDRYVVSSRTDGRFRVRPYSRLDRSHGEELDAVLLPCRNCLRQLNYQDFAAVNRLKQDRIVADFSIRNFFENFEPVFRCLPLYKETTFPTGSRLTSWARISYRTRQKAGWICACCKVNCENAKGFLHTHHKDGNRENNRSENHEVLCFICHRNRPLHERMHIQYNDRLKLKQLRADQSLNPRCDTCGE